MIINPEIEKKHQEGVSQSIRSEITEADRTLKNALDSTIEGYAINGCTSWMDQSLHRGRIHRDIALNHLRGLVIGYHTSSEAATDEFEKSHMNLSSVLAAAKTAAKTKYPISRNGARYLRTANAELGATVTTKFRIASFACRSALTHSELLEQSSDARKLYQQADEYLKEGNNSYYGANNAVLAARHEVAFGSRLRMLQMLGKAAAYTLRSIVFDRNNLIPSVKTIASRAPSLVSQKRALKSFTNSNPSIFSRGKIVNI